jgi:hypothetical protein
MEERIIQIAKEKACKEFLNQYDISIVEVEEYWEVNFIPRKMSLGGGV